MTTSGAERQEGCGQTTSPEDREEGKGEQVGYTPTPEDLRLWKVYGDWFHANPVTHLDGGISNNLVWQAWWCDLSFMTLRRYDAPSGKVGRRFVETLRGELRGSFYRQWNSEHFIVFQTVILQQE